MTTHIYGFGGEWDALTALNELDTGKNLTDAHKAEMFEKGYMDDDLKPTAAGKKAYADRKIDNTMYVGGRVTSGPNHFVMKDPMFDEDVNRGDPRLSEVVSLGHGAGVPQPRFPASQPVSYQANDGEDPLNQMQGTIIDGSMDMPLPRKGKPPQAS